MSVKKPEVMKMLGLTDLFGGLSTDSKRMVSGIAIPRRLEKGECLMAEGESGGALFLLGSGSIKLTKQGPDIKEVTVKIVSEGEIFGEVVLFEDDKYPVTGTAIKRSTVFILPREQFYCLLEHRGFRDDFFKLLIAKQRYLANRLKYFQLNDLEKRFFLFLRERYGEKYEIKPDISQKEMAAAIGTVPEVLSRLLLRLKKSGKVEWEGGVLKLNKEVFERC